jgi:predicted molibdopterin-dependent oxidoreductase YjgC
VASQAIKTKNIDSSVSLYADTESLKLSDIADFDSTDLIVLVGLDTSQWTRVLPALDASVRKKIKRGAKLIVINSSETGMASVAAVSIKGDEAGSLAQIARALGEKGTKINKDMEKALSTVHASEEAVKAAELITGALEPLILSSPALFKASRNISLLKDTKVVAVSLEANARGVVASGIVSSGKTYNEMAAGKVDTLYAVGEVSVHKRPKVDFLIVQASYMTELARQADLVLPAATFLESKGTMISYLGRTKDVRKLADPPGSVKQHKDIFFELSKAMGKPIKETAAKGKTAPAKSAKPVLSPFEKQKGLDVNTEKFINSLYTPVVNCSRLVWLKETEKVTV